MLAKASRLFLALGIFVLALSAAIPVEANSLHRAQALPGSTTGRAIPTILGPAMAGLRRDGIRIPVYMPGWLPNFQPTIQQDHSRFMVSVGPSHQAYTVMLAYPESCCTGAHQKKFFIPILLIRGRRGAIGKLGPGSRRVALGGGRMGYYDPHRSSETLWRPPTLYWSTGAITYTTGLNTNTPGWHAKLMHMGRSLERFSP